MAPMFYFDPSMEPKWPHLQEAKAAPWGQNGPNKITVHQLFDIRVKPRNRRFFTRSCLIGACLSKIVLKFVFQIFQATFGLSIFSIFSHGIFDRS